jgi:polysaccharide export outer membrane protein
MAMASAAANPASVNAGPGDAGTVPHPSAPIGPVSDYVLGGGDQVVINVDDLEEISNRSVRIDPDGGVDLPLVGRIQVSGMTIEQFKAALAQRLSKYISNPNISINLTDNESRTVSVIGEVNSPGIHPLPRPRDLVEVISFAGGVKADAGSRIIITRNVSSGPLPLPGAKTDSTGHYTTAELSLDDVLAAKTPSDNILIQPGDVVSIPKGEIVYVVGDVHRPGGFPLTSHESMSLLQAISLAEGFAPNAATRSAKILRPVPGASGMPKEIPIDVKNIFAGKAPDVPLYANDILFIPDSAAKSGTRRAAEAVLQVVTGVAIYSR